MAWNDAYKFGRAREGEGYVLGGDSGFRLKPLERQPRGAGKLVIEGGHALTDG